ncbi:MAG: secondary thiamine-phosphate synthase enzyme YjbQ [Eubacteriales bacterium]|nr:secondary thiamine-phosphate synthase enzyme YjbQ [Eubacteriales bacterium]NLF46779.1 YjbQ family protein [Clostridiales bacterium]
MKYSLEVKTSSRTQMLDITKDIEKIIKESEIKNGSCIVFIPHTTAAVTINENADPDVQKDFIKAINKIVPWDDDYLHMEGNSAAHLKASMIGFSEQLMVEKGRILLGTWQGIYFVEFDGPRNRKVWVSIFAYK